MPGAKHRSSPRARAALAWTEALTLIVQGHAPDKVYDQLRQQFFEKEIVDLTAAVCAINTWNRIAISFRATPQVESARVAAYPMRFRPLV